MKTEKLSLLLQPVIKHVMFCHLLGDVGHFTVLFSTHNSLLMKLFTGLTNYVMQNYFNVWKS